MTKAKTDKPVIVITDINGKQTTSSLNVAKVFGKQHRNVMRDIERVIAEIDDSEFNALNFEHVKYIDAKGESRQCVELTKDAFTYLVMGYRGAKASQFKLAYIKQFNKMAGDSSSFGARANALALQAKNLKVAGSSWGKFGAELQRAKRENKAAIKKLGNDMQMGLFDDDNLESAA